MTSLVSLFFDCHDSFYEESFPIFVVFVGVDEDDMGIRYSCMCGLGGCRSFFHVLGAAEAEGASRKFI